MGVGEVIPQIRFQHEHVERVRSLHALKSRLASPTLASLVEAIENEELSRLLRRLLSDADSERAELEEIAREWMVDASKGPRERLVEPTYRDIVEEWASLHDAAARRARSLAASAPSPRLASRLLDLAQRDEEHAASLRTLL